MAVTAFYQQDKAVLKLYLPLTQEAHQQIGIATSAEYSPVRNAQRKRSSVMPVITVSASIILNSRMIHCLISASVAAVIPSGSLIAGGFPD
jgi:hypothetical protein